MAGKTNIPIGFLTMVFFMIHSFLSICLRAFAPDKIEWINATSIATL
jgi:hypothetical protein